MATEPAEDSDEEDEAEEPEDSEDDSDHDESEYESADEFFFSPEEEDSPEGRDPRAKVLSVLELEDLFLKMAPDLSGTSFISSRHYPPHHQAYV